MFISNNVLCILASDHLLHNSIKIKNRGVLVLTSDKRFVCLLVGCFLGPRGPLRVPSSVRSSVRLSAPKI